MKLLIIRHGDPDYSIDNLTPRGVIEVERLSERLVAEEKISKIYCSPLGRARATAAPTAQKLGLEPIIHDWLREFPANIKTTYRPDGMCPWEMRPVHFGSIPELTGFESWKAVSPYAESRCPEVFDNICERMSELLAGHGYKRTGSLYEVQEKNDETYAFFCHFGLGSALISYFTEISLPQLWLTAHLPTSSVTEIGFRMDDDNPALARATCSGIGDLSHMYGSGMVKNRR